MIVLMNGPIGCGKGVAYNHTRKVFGAKDGRVKKHLYKVASALFGVTNNMWEARLGKETPNGRLQITAGEFKKLRKVITIQATDVNAQLIGAKYGYYKLTPRQALIYVSEVVCKPTFGDSYFGDMRLRLVDKPGLYVDDSCGFIAELDKLCEPRIIQVMGRGEFKTDDTRQYISKPGIPCVTIFNTGTQEQFVRDVENTVREWINENKR